METADEIIQELKKSRTAGKLVKKYSEAKRYIRALEKDRKSLLAVINAVPGRYEWEDYGRYRKRLESVTIPREDASLLQEYIDSLELVNTIEVAIRERLESPRKAETEDMLLNNITVSNMQKKYAISEKTVKRLKKRGLDAVEKEMAMRIGCGRWESSNCF